MDDHTGDHCAACGFEQVSYNSCRNRHCPKCQGRARAQWVADREADLLPVPYFHVVFTLPHQLNTLVQFNQRLLLNLLFRSAWQTLSAFGQRHLKGTTGCTMVLHTWDQTLGPHYHVHGVVPAGALSFDGGTWRHPEKKNTKFLFAVKAMSQVFRGKYVEGLKQLDQQGQLCWPTFQGRDDLFSEPPEPRDMKTLVDQLYRKPWVVYAKRPFGSPQQVIRYLGRYTHRVAISNRRITAIEDGRVTFTYRDRKNNGCKTLTLGAHEFIRRFLRHVLPSGFVRIRHYGILANRGKRQRLKTIRSLIEHAGPCHSCVEPVASTGPVPEAITLTDHDPARRCPRCHVERLQRETLAPVRAARPATRGPPAPSQAQLLIER